jgi:XTP/dITP diphosphohydrolase
MTLKCLLATNNAHKVGEYRPLLAGAPVEILTPADLDLALEVDEDGATYAANAAKKAVAFARASGLLALADDSGLEVFALGGEPGVRSSRYAGPDATDRDRIALVLARLAALPGASRAARFVCAIALARPGGEVEVVEGECRGEIAESPRGGNGFGYDPIFYLPALGKTIAELSDEEKNRVSHRARAAEKARAALARRAADDPGGRTG